MNNAIKAEEQQIMQLVEKETALTRDKNVDALMPFYAKGILSFDVVGPLEYSGANSVKQRMESWFSSFEGPIGINIRDLSIAVAGDVAFCHCLRNVDATNVSGNKLNMWWRETTCFRKTDGSWLIMHRHSSVPFNAENGHASMDLKPDSKTG